MKTPRARIAWTSLGGAILVLLLHNGCDQVTGSTSGKTIDLYPPTAPGTETIEVEPAEDVQIRWSPADPDFPVWLVYRDLATQAEEIIATDADGGLHPWTIPTTLRSNGDYEVREYDPLDGTLIAVSPPIRVTPGADAGSSGLPAGSPCTADSECDDGLFCNGVESCANGTCSNGLAPCTLDLCDEITDSCAPTPCTIDADCADGEACAQSACIAVNPGTNGLDGRAFFVDSGDPVDFDERLTVGDQLRLISPATEACSCAWSVVPNAADTFDAPDACTTSFIVAASGAFNLIVDTYCPDAALRYVQSAGAVDPPSAAPSIEVLAENTLVPYVVRFNLRLKDAAGKVIPTGVTADNFHILEDGQPVDFTETNRFVAPAENLPLRVVLVLDYTTSMEQADAIDAMIDSAANLVLAEHFTATHQFAVVEFHDRTSEGEGYNLVVPLTTASSAGKTTIVAGIPKARNVESGLSRVWDAVELALTTLGEVERQPGEAQVVIFLTDGRDTTSDASPTALANAAAENNVMLYPIGFGDVTQTESLLKSMAARTGGAYFAAADADELRTAFAQLADDLRGQWNLSYVTPRNSGSVKVSVEFDWDGNSTGFETTVEAGTIAGDIHKARLTVLDREYNAFTDRTSFVLHADYIPRNIDRFRFLFAHSEAEFTLQDDGGLTPPSGGWSLTATGDGSYLLLNPDALEYGAFGHFGTVTVPGEVDALQVLHDDSLYTDAAQPKTFEFDGDLWAQPYTLEALTSTETKGIVIISPDKASYGHGEVVQLTAVETGGEFDRWSGDSSSTDKTIELTMDEDKSVIAVFK